MSGRNSGNKNYLIGGLVVVILVLGYLVFSQSQKKEGVSIDISDKGIEITEN